MSCFEYVTFLLPLTAPGLGVESATGLMLGCVQGCSWKIDGLSCQPLMPAPDEHVQATVRLLSTKEAGSWLTLLLKPKVEVLNLSEPLKYSSHSYKATALSYLVKYGCILKTDLRWGIMLTKYAWR